MELFPAIDLRGGRCVRLLRGDYDAETVYDDDPIDRARRFIEAGACWIHVVDLDAARSGEAEGRATANREVIAGICGEAARADVAVQVGGGVRSVDAAERLWSSGATRVVVGTAAVEDPRLVDELVARGHGRVAVGLDARGRDVAVRGWTESAGADLLDLVGRFDRTGVDALVVTSIGRDGTLDGPDIEQLTAVLALSTVDVVASGGVGTLDHVRDLAALRVDGRGLSGAIIGKALYEGRFELREALAVDSRHEEV